MKKLLIACLCLIALPVLATAQALYPSSPDWTSLDTQRSTGGAFADIDNDGWLDFVVANGNDMNRQYVAVYYNKGDGTFPTLPDWQATDQTYNGHLDVADVNGDGWIDVGVVHLVSSAQGRSAAKLYLNNNGTLSSQPDWSSNEEAYSFGISFGDINCDGRPDMAVATGWAYSPAKYYKNYVYMNVNGQLESSASWQSDVVTTDQGALFCDADNDGWMDLAFTGANFENRLFRNVNGTLSATPVWESTDSSGQDGIMMTAGDVDNDGYIELYTTDNSQMGGGRFHQYSGTPVNYFTTNATWTYYEGYCSSVALADVDADHDLDLATGAWWDYTRLFFNNGSGFGSPGWSSGPSSVIEKIVFGDIDPTPYSLKRTVNKFAPDGGRRLFHLTRKQIQSVESVTLDGTQLDPSQYMVSREFGWITVHAAPVTELVVNFTYSVSLDMGITNWDASIGNYLYYNDREHEWLSASAGSISASTGGTCDFSMQNGIEDAGRKYLLLGGATGSSPGYPLPGGMAVLPINWDIFTDLVFAYVNTSLFTNFLGTLDASGNATAQLVAPPLTPSTVGTILTFAFVVNGPFDFASNPVEVEIVP